MYSEEGLDLNEVEIGRREKAAKGNRSLFFRMRLPRTTVPLDVVIYKMCLEFSKSCEILGIQYIGNDIWEVAPLNGKLKTLGKLNLFGTEIELIEDNPNIDPPVLLKIRKVPFHATIDQVAELLAEKLNLKLRSNISLGLARDDEGGVSKFHTGTMSVWIREPKNDIPRNVKCFGGNLELLCRTASKEKMAAKKCFICNEEGHLKKDCMKSKEVVCYRCNKPGHIQRHCDYVFPIDNQEPDREEEKNQEPEMEEGTILSDEEEEDGGDLNDTVMYTDERKRKTIEEDSDEIRKRKKEKQEKEKKEKGGTDKNIEGSQNLTINWADT